MAVKTNGFTIPEELIKLLLSLASNWGDMIDSNTLKVVHLSGAMTNEVYRISWPTKMANDSRTVLVRIYGEGADRFFNRNDEIRTFECLSRHGQGPHLLGQFPEGRVEEFIHARDKLSKSLIFTQTEVFSQSRTFVLIQVEFPLHSKTLAPYPLISDSDIFGGNLGLAEMTSAQRPRHVAPRLTRRRHLATCWYSENISPQVLCYVTFM
ncbi:hypothetical protein TEA_015511 [Camellia sinensis var. sinensis]|uniref:Choline kinase N-terminal domain-containing protein n=1 Tax=Camellia sinensis var. sinensis TaxID=542762 RepID=A0A4S4DMG3_CAMSN|nr:hypothetical protein TEA_015511 [Camellia sinensis var. sinensis]